jgi:arylsulfatase A-like enzyme
MKRRRFITDSAQGIAALSLAAQFPELFADPGKTNVLFVSIDDMSDWAGPFGTANQKVFTPGLDKLAAMGTTFTRAYCAAPACGPSRNAVMSGVHPINYSDDGWGHFRQYAGNSVVIPQLFKDAGYKVLGAGKLFHGAFTKDDRAEFENPSVEPAMWNEYKNFPPDPLVAQMEKSAKIKFGPLYSDNEEGMPDRQILRWAQQQISQTHDRPFFLGVGFYRPHLPWFLPQRFFDLYPLDQIRIPDVPIDDLADIPQKGQDLSLKGDDHRTILSEGNWAKAIQAYLASMTFADDCLLQLLNSLEASPHKDQTLIVLWTDHGWHLGEKLGWRKFKLWERATKVPLIFAGPGVAKGAKNNSVVSLMDVRPTLVDLAFGQTVSSEFGVSLREHLSNPAKPLNRPVVTAWGKPEDRHVTVRTDRWRYILYSDGTEELYDHDADPKEHFNLLATEKSKSLLQDTVRALKAVVGR